MAVGWGSKLGHWLRAGEVTRSLYENQFDNAVDFGLQAGVMGC